MTDKHPAVSAPPTIPKLLRKRDLLQQLPISEATFHRLVADGTFKPIRLSARITAYEAQAVNAYLRSKGVEL